MASRRVRASPARRAPAPRTVEWTREPSIRSEPPNGRPEHNAIDLHRRTSTVLISTLLANKGSDVATIDGNATVADAVDELSRHHVGALVVSADGERIEG